jgi:hypothetical protein
MIASFKLTAGILLSCLGFAPQALFAQKAAIQKGIERSMEKKYADPQRKKGREELEKITYENDKRYKDAENKEQATLSFENKTFNKNGELKSTSTDKIVFGSHGECMVMREGEKDEMWMIFNYADKANYMVNVKDKNAIKMPLINMKKMVERAAQKEAEKTEAGDKSSWSATEERQQINGYNCRKFIYTYADNKHFSSMDAWVSGEVKLDLSGNYLLGARLDAYKFPANPEYKEMAAGFIVRSVLYSKKGKPESQRDLVSFKKTAEERYFDLSSFKVIDVLGQL